MDSREDKDAAYDLNYMAETGLLSMNQDTMVRTGFTIDIAGGSFMLVPARAVGGKNAESASIY
jgi:dUTPase